MGTVGVAGINTREQTVSDVIGRAEFLAANPRARAWAALEEATDAQHAMLGSSPVIPEGHFDGKTAIIIGAGVGGLTTAYELLAQKTGMKVIVFEAHNRTGGRCLSLRTGDTLTEDESVAIGTEHPIKDRERQLFDAPTGETQVVRFKRPVGDAEPYLNAGPGRIPSGHKRLLGYLRDFGVDVEIYVMNSMSNLVQMKDGPLGNDEPVVYRRIDHNVRGWIAQMVFANAETLLATLPSSAGIDPDDLKDRARQLKSLMVTFGELDSDGTYVPDAGDEGFEDARSRAGFNVLPGVEAGQVAEALDLDSLLSSKFWKKTRFYQPADFLWQQAIFQPVGGMDRVQHAFAQQVAALGGDIHLNSPVTGIKWHARSQKYTVEVAQIGTDETTKHKADYVFSNLAMPFLSRILDPALQDLAKPDTGFDAEFTSALHKVYQAQFDPQFADGGVARTFLAPTSKVGWQGDRDLWQGQELAAIEVDGMSRKAVPESEVGVVPIFGGISWTDHPIVQIWYPSNDYHDTKGVLTGAYNFGKNAIRYGEMTPKARLKNANKGAAKFGQRFADGLHDGVTIAWQNIPHIKGGWAVWQALGDGDDAPIAVGAFNALAKGTGVPDGDGGRTPPNFFIVGDQLSSLPGWQEGAIAAALAAVDRASFPHLEPRKLSALPDTRLMVEGV